MKRLYDVKCAECDCCFRAALDLSPEEEAGLLRLARELPFCADAPTLPPVCECINCGSPLCGPNLQDAQRAEPFDPEQEGVILYDRWAVARLWRGRDVVRDAKVLDAETLGRAEGFFAQAKDHASRAHPNARALTDRAVDLSRALMYAKAQDITAAKGAVSSYSEDELKIFPVEWSEYLRLVSEV